MLEQELKSSTNVYRTSCFIVKQVMGINQNTNENNSVCSFDTYYKRTKLLDDEYEKLFKIRKYVNGTRLPSTLYTRIYVR